MSAPLVVVSVVAWNTADLVLQCLDALYASTYPNFRVVVVDNASRDDVAARAQGRWPDLDVIHSPTNLGFGRGHALALAQARTWQADAIWLVNSDALVEPDALARLVDAWRAHGDALYGAAPLAPGAGGATLMNFPDKYLDPDGLPRPFRRDRPVVYDAAWAARAPFVVGAVTGSAFFVPLAVAGAHGWFDPGWFMYCEEVDYCYRLRAAGVASWLVPQARVRHGGGGSRRGRRGVDDVIAYYRARNEIELARRYAAPIVTAVTAAKKFARGAVTALVAPRRGANIVRGALDALEGRFGKTLAPEDRLGDGDA
jgi:GT2 family glycosyltransferase